MPALSIDGALGELPGDGGRSDGSDGLRPVCTSTPERRRDAFASRPAREHAGAGSISRVVRTRGRRWKAASLSAACGRAEVRARAAYGGEGRRVPVVAIELGAGYVALPVAACAMERRPCTPWRARGSRSASTSAWASDASAGTTASRLERQPHRRAQPEPSGRIRRCRRCRRCRHCRRCPANRRPARRRGERSRRGCR